MVILLYSNSKNNKENGILKKIILGIICFIIFSIAYYFAIAMISLVSLSFISRDFSGGLWAVGLILGITLSPILSNITTIKILNKNTKVETPK